MKVPKPESRKCDECRNTMTLNLFRLNSAKCRYCQDGISVPERLIEVESTNEDILKDSRILKSIEKPLSLELKDNNQTLEVKDT